MGPHEEIPTFLDPWRDALYFTDCKGLEYMGLSAAQPTHQYGELPAVLFGQRSELNSQALARPDVANHSVGANLAFADQEVQLGGRADHLLDTSFQKQSASTHIVHPRDFIAPIAVPIDPQFLGHRQAGTNAPRWRTGVLQQMAHFQTQK